jgi:hypothetical protein
MVADFVPLLVGNPENYAGTLVPALATLLLHARRIESILAGRSSLLPVSAVAFNSQLTAIAVPLHQ